MMRIPWWGMVKIKAIPCIARRSRKAKVAPSFPFIFYLLSFILLLGCGSQEVVVATVSSHSISAKEVEAFARSLLPGLKTSKTDMDARWDYLQTMIDERLLIIETQAQGLDTTAAFGDKLNEAILERVLQTYAQPKVVRNVEVDEAEIQRVFVEEGYDHSRRMSHIVVATREEALELRNQLKAGASFDSLARTRSLDRGSASRGGDMGFVPIYRAHRMAIPEDVFRSLPLGEVSELLPIRRSYHLVRFTDEAPADYEAVRPRIQQRLWREAYRFESRALAEELGARLHLNLSSEGLRLLTAGRSLSPDEEKTPLYRYNGGVITIADYVQTFGKRSLRPNVSDSTQVVRGAWQTVIPDIMFWEMARRDGFLKQKEMVQWIARKREDLLILSLRKKEVEDRIHPGEEEVRQFYDEHLTLFRVPEEVWIREILLETWEEAEKLLDEIRDSADMEELAVQHTIRHGAKEVKGRWKLSSYERRPLYVPLVQPALEAEAGDLIGPIKVQNGFSIFRVLEKIGGTIQPYERAHRRAQTILRQRQIEEGFNALVSALREKYADQIHIYEDRLPAIHLEE